MKRTADVAFPPNEDESNLSAGLPQPPPVASTSQPHATRPQHARIISRKGSKGSTTLRRGPTFLDTASQQKAATAANLILKRASSLPKSPHRVNLSSSATRAGPSGTQQNQPAVATPPTVSKAQRRSNVIQRAKPFMQVDELDDNESLPSPSKRQKLEKAKDDDILRDISNETSCNSFLAVTPQPKSIQTATPTLSQSLIEAGYRFIASLGFSGWMSTPIQDIPSPEINTNTTLPHLTQPDEDVEMDEPETPVAEEAHPLEQVHDYAMQNAQPDPLAAPVIHNPQLTSSAPSNPFVHNAQPSSSNPWNPVMSVPQPSSSTPWNPLTHQIRMPTFRPTALIPFYTLEQWRHLDRYPHLVEHVIGPDLARLRAKRVAHVQGGFKPSENPRCHLARPSGAPSPLSSEIFPDRECASDRLTSQCSLGSSASTISMESQDEVSRAPAPVPIAVQDVRVVPTSKERCMDVSIRNAILSGFAISPRDRWPYYPAFTAKQPGEAHSDLLRRTTLLTNFGYWLVQEGLWDFMQGARLSTLVQWWETDMFDPTRPIPYGAGQLVVQKRPKVRLPVEGVGHNTALRNLRPKGEPVVEP